MEHPNYLPDSKLHIRKESFKKLTDHLLSKDTNEGLFVSSIFTGKYHYVSSSYCTIKGYEAENFYKGGVDFFNAHIHPDDHIYLLEKNLQVHQEIAAPEFDRSIPKIIPQRYRVKHANGYFLTLNVYLTILSYTVEGKADKIMGLIQKANQNNKLMFCGLKNQERAFCKLLNIAVIYHDQFPDPINDQVSYGSSSSSLKPSEKKNKTTLSVNISRREKEVLSLIANGLSSKEIADKLFISAHTAINHRKNLIEKFKVRNTAELIYRALRLYSIT